MTQRKALKGIANGLLGTFISRNNDINGYWGLGILRSYALQLELLSLVIDLIDGNSSLDFDSPIRVAKKTYKRWLFDMAAKAGFDPKELEIAEIRLRFATFDEFPNAIRDTRGEPYLCTVVLAKRDGVAFSVTKIGVCAPHNPKIDHQSNRVDEYSRRSIFVASIPHTLYSKSNMRALLEQALKLPLAERIHLADDLYMSVGEPPGTTPLTDAQIAELERRLAEHRRNSQDAIPVEDFLKRFDARRALDLYGCSP